MQNFLEIISDLITAHFLDFEITMQFFTSRHGLHTFVVPIRDPINLKAFPGVVIGDMGEKIGLNGLDNGFVMFDHYRIPRDALLNKNGGINEEGKSRN